MPCPRAGGGIADVGRRCRDRQRETGPIGQEDPAGIGNRLPTFRAVGGMRPGSGWLKRYEVAMRDQHPVGGICGVGIEVHHPPQRRLAHLFSQLLVGNVGSEWRTRSCIRYRAGTREACANSHSTARNFCVALASDRRGGGKAGPGAIPNNANRLAAYALSVRTDQDSTASDSCADPRRPIRPIGRKRHAVRVDVAVVPSRRPSTMRARVARSFGVSRPLRKPDPAVHDTVTVARNARSAPPGARTGDGGSRRRCWRSTRRPARVDVH